MYPYRIVLLTFRLPLNQDGMGQRVVPEMRGSAVNRLIGVGTGLVMGPMGATGPMEAMGDMGPMGPMEVSVTLLMEDPVLTEPMGIMGATGPTGPTGPMGPADLGMEEIREPRNIVGMIPM